MPILRIDENINEEIELNNFLSSISHVELETNQSSFLTYIVDVKLKNELMYIVDFSKNILIFDLNRKFIRKISSIGEGPGQYEFFPSLVFDDIHKKNILDRVMKYWCTQVVMTIFLRLNILFSLRNYFF